MKCLPAKLFARRATFLIATHLLASSAVVTPCSDAVDRGERFSLKGNCDEAIAQYEVALQLQSHDAEALHGRGVALLFKDKSEKAIADFTEAGGTPHARVGMFFQLAKAVTTS